MSKKTYGLILPKQEKLKQEQERLRLMRSKPVFDQDELEEDEDEGLQLPQRSGPGLIPSSSKVNNLVKKEISKALQEDPSVFAYDEVYEDMKSDAAAAAGNPLERGPKKPKYMDNLLKSAELRKREKDRREEKMIQKEREAEGEEFKDKEAFVTSAYKEKLKELRETEARERNEAAYEARLDVKKQQDLSGFYRHLLNQETGSEKVSMPSSADRFSVTAAQAPNQAASFKKSAVSGHKNLRKRKGSESDESADEEEKYTDESKGPAEESKPEADPVAPKVSTDDSKEPAAQPGSTLSLTEATTTLVPDPEPVVQVDRRELILKVFQKRTVGAAFDEAVRRFQERQQPRSA